MAFGLGIVHALSPGHGKTIMAAYLVGSGGSSRQAIGLGLAVTVSHTLGVLALAAITLGASSFLPPEQLYPVLGVVSGALVIAIGGSLLWSRLRVIRRDRAHARAHAGGADHGHEHRTGTRTGTRTSTRTSRRAPCRGAECSRSGCPADSCPLPPR